MQHPMKLKEVKRLNLWEQKTALKSVSTSEISNQLYLLFYCISHCKQIFGKRMTWLLSQIYILIFIVQRCELMWFVWMAIYKKYLLANLTNLPNICFYLKIIDCVVQQENFKTIWCKKTKKKNCDVLLIRHAVVVSRQGSHSERPRDYSHQDLDAYVLLFLS